MKTTSSNLRNTGAWVPPFIFALLALAPCWDLTVSAQSHLEGMGSIPYAEPAGTGVAFRVWAPHAQSVQVTGDFNNWKTTDLAPEPDTGTWSVDVPGALPGQHYNYIINESSEKRDPRARQVTNTRGKSVIYDRDAFDWEGVAPVLPEKNDLVIMELHVGTFFDPAPDDGKPATFDEMVAKLDYLRDLGINAIEVMPINEFPGVYSWGYNPIDQFAVENEAHGGPDGFKRLVKACHERGIAVLLDIVHNHWGPGKLDLWNFDGWSGGGMGGGIYFYQEEGKHGTPWGSRPHFGRPEVRAFILDQVRMWLDEYRLDGFRWDSTVNINHYDSPAGQQFLPEGDSLMNEANALIRRDFPGRISIAENGDAPASFDAEWHLGFHGTLEWALRSETAEDRTVNALADLGTHLLPDFRQVVFSESHDTVGDLNGGVRLTRKFDEDNPLEYDAKKRAMLANLIVMTVPGIPMLFQGQEWLEEDQWGAGTPMDWSKSEERSRWVQYHKDLIRLRRNLDGRSGGLKGKHIDAFVRDEPNKLLAYRRWSGGAESDDVIVVINASGQTIKEYWIDFPSAGPWHVQLNTDWKQYDGQFGHGGPGTIEAVGAPPRAPVSVAPYSALVLSQAEPAVLRNLHIAARGNLLTGRLNVTFDLPDGYEKPLVAEWSRTSAFEEVSPLTVERSGPHAVIQADIGPGSERTERMLRIREKAGSVLYEGRLVWDQPLRMESRMVDGRFAARGVKTIHTELHNLCDEDLLAEVMLRPGNDVSVDYQEQVVVVPAERSVSLFWPVRLEPGLEVGDTAVTLDLRIHDVPVATETVNLARQSRWVAVAPFPAEPLAAFGTLFPPEWKYDADVAFDNGQKPVQWEQVDPEHVRQYDGINFETLYGQMDHCAGYAMTRIESGKERKAELRIGSDDTLTAWVNGEQVHAAETYRAIRWDEEVIPVRFRQGVNTVVLKVTQGSGAWGLVFHVTAPGGEPLEGLRDAFEDFALYAVGRPVAQEALGRPDPLQWKVSGPYPFADHRGQGGEGPLDGAASEGRWPPPSEGLSWKTTVGEPDAEGAVDLHELLGKAGDCFAYAVTTVNADRAHPVEIRSGSDDGLVLWLNGERVFEDHEYHALEAGRQVTRALLKPGLNVLYARIGQGGDRWAFDVKLWDISQLPAVPMGGE